MATICTSSRRSIPSKSSPTSQSTPHAAARLRAESMVRLVIIRTSVSGLRMNARMYSVLTFPAPWIPTPMRWVISGLLKRPSGRPRACAQCLCEDRRRARREGLIPLPPSVRHLDLVPPVRIGIHGRYIAHVSVGAGDQYQPSAEPPLHLQADSGECLARVGQKYH